MMTKTYINPELFCVYWTANILSIFIILRVIEVINDQVQLTLLQYYNVKFHVTVLSDYAITMPHVCLMACVNLCLQVIDLNEIFAPIPLFKIIFHTQDSYYIQFEALALVYFRIQFLRL